METSYIIALSISVIMGLIGLIYKLHENRIKRNEDGLETVKGHVASLDSRVDSRLDVTEKDIIVLKEKIK